MQKSGIISMENLFEVKAPLASFDTVDLGDEERLEVRSVECLPTTPECEDSLAESVDSQSSNTSHNVDSELQWEGQSESDMLEGALSNLAGTDVQQCVDETDSTKDEQTATTGSAETNSSENSAAGSADILQRLKLKSKKHKETESKVKYQQIENSDLSDHEKSPLPELKLVSAYKICDSDTDSSDSDSGYIRTGYIAALKGTKKGASKKNKNAGKVKERYNFSTPDSTPNASPKVFRPILPPPLTDEERAQQSKRKAYEKRLQRLKVTTAPIERPRSTTPIDIFGLEEYAYISSPEKTPQNSKLEKLKITLPPEEFHPKGQSPRKSSKIAESHDPHVFTFNEDLLFTHTKSALIVQGDIVKGHSPKKILIPPTLSPALSPRSQRCSSALNLSPRSPRYYYTPTKTNTNIHVGNNWARFEETDNPNPVSQVNVKEGIANNNGHLKGNISTDSFELAAKDKVLNDEEILTVNVQVVNETKICDIKCECVAKADDRNMNEDVNHSPTSTPLEFVAFDKVEKADIPTFANFDQVDGNEMKHADEDSQIDIWVPHESNTQGDTKSETILNSNTDSNIGETLKEIIDNAFKEESFELNLDEKESICDNVLNNKTASDTANQNTGTALNNKMVADTTDSPVIDTRGQKEAYVTDCIDQNNSSQWQN